MRHQFNSVTWQVMGPLLAWLACFSGVYGIGALACARGIAGMQWAGVGITGLLAALLVIAAAAFTLWRIASARRLHWGGEEQKFNGFLALSLGGLVLLGLVLVWLPVLVVRPPCTGQPALEVGASAPAAAGTMPAFPAGL